MSSEEDLRSLTHDELVARANRLHVTNASDRTRDDLLALLESHRPRRGGGWLGRARDLVARVVEQGLHMPDAANLLRGSTTPPLAPPPLPTVTLAEIYAAQGHHKKALGVLEEVLEREPDHAEARALHASYADQGGFVAPSSNADTVEATAAAEPKNAPPAKTPTAVVTSSGAAPAPMKVALASAEPSDAKLDRGASNRSAGRMTKNDVVGLATDPTSIFVYWEIRPITFARARWRDPRGQLILRIVSVSADLDAETSALRGNERDINIDGLSGENFIRALTADAEVRLCVGWVGPRGFVPLAVATDIRMPRENRGETEAHNVADSNAAAQRRQTTRIGTRPDTIDHAAVRQALLRHDPTAGFSAGDLAAVAIRESHNVRVVDFSVATHSHPGSMGHGTGGAVAPYGGASDLYGGASDLYGGASDLYGDVTDS